MPEFILAHGSAEAEGVYNKLPAFVRGYIECMFFTNTGTGDDGDLEDADTSELSSDALAAIIADCEAFQKDAAPLLALAYQREGYDEAAAGRDYWYTRNGHGVGFWDRDALKLDVFKLADGRLSDLEEGTRDAELAGVLCDLLSDACRYDEMNIVRGGDGMIYFE